MLKKYFHCCFLNDIKNCRSNLNNCAPPPTKKIKKFETYDKTDQYMYHSKFFCWHYLQVP